MTDTQKDANDPAHDLPDDPREPMTDAQAAEIRRLADATGSDVTLNMTQREAERYLEELRERVPDLPFLVPGVGAQGAGLAELRAVFGDRALESGQVLATASRAVLGAGPDGLADAAAALNRDLTAAD